MLPVSRLIGHKEYGNQPNGWPGRKNDPTYSMDWRRQRVAAFTPRNQEDELPTTKEVVDAILSADVSDAYSGTQSFKNVTSQMWTNSRTLLAQVAGLTAAVGKLAAAVAGDDLTAAELKAAVQQAIAESIVQVDVNVSGQQPPPAA